MSAVRNQETLDKLVETLADNGGDMHLACKVAGCSYGFVMAWKKSDPIAENAINEAVAAGTSVLESAMIRRAVKGVKEPIVSGGAIIGYKRKFSDGLLEFALKARDPGTYGTKIDVNKTITVKTLSDAELDKRIEDLSTRLGLTYQPLPEGEFDEVIEDAEYVELELDDLL